MTIKVYPPQYVEELEAELAKLREALKDHYEGMCNIEAVKRLREENGQYRQDAEDKNARLREVEKEARAVAQAPYPDMRRLRRALEGRDRDPSDVPDNHAEDAENDAAQVRAFEKAVQERREQR